MLKKYWKETTAIVLTGIIVGLGLNWYKNTLTELLKADEPVVETVDRNKVSWMKVKEEPPVKYKESLEQKVENYDFIKGRQAVFVKDYRPPPNCDSSFVYFEVPGGYEVYDMTSSYWQKNKNLGGQCFSMKYLLNRPRPVYFVFDKNLELKDSGYTCFGKVDFSLPEHIIIQPCF